MRKHLLTFATAALWLATAAHGQITDQFATGNMHFDAKAMDANSDGRITREELTQYAHRLWSAMSGGKPTVPVQQAAQDFARGNMRVDARAMDADRDGTISESEFMTFLEHRFDKMKGPDGTLPTVSAAQAFSRGNPPHVASAPSSQR